MIRSLHLTSSARLGATLLALSAGALGCDTKAFCFSDCEDGAGGSGGAEVGGGEPTGSTGTFGPGAGGGSSGTFTTGVGGGMQCQQTNGGVELCDGLDNDCDGTIDDADFSSPKQCGVCGNDCYKQNVDPQTVTCTPTNDGQPELCESDCAQDYFDLDGDGGCEYYCVAIGVTDVVCNNADDDCNGVIDEEVDFCAPANCGACGSICVVGNGTPACVKDDPNDPQCTAANTSCQIAACDPGWVDLDGQYGTGCEYACTPSGNEVCGDGIDNDCDGKIDGADDLSGDPAIGVACFGDPDGKCATMAHVGVTGCVDGQVACTGPNVLRENDTAETCNGVDDDCDGLADDTPTDVGGSCGQSNIAPCTYGTWQCNSGTLTCVGEIKPKTETCNGIDDNCDGTIDKTGNTPPADAMGVCGQFPAPPQGATSPCMTGMKSCTGGVVTCVGAKGPTSTQDSCGVDANCDGTLTNQPNKMTDIANCGMCGNNCYAGKINEIYTCEMGMCKRQGCLAGYYDLDNNGSCEYACTFISAQESCNGVDDNCNGQIDENPTVPSKVSTCGISPAASRPECTTGVTLACMNGAWKCTFPTGVCSPTCATAVETCDNLDNDCDGVLNENVPDFGAACASDDGLAVGHGACRTTGTKVCNGPSATKCSAMKGDCVNLPGGCTEACDGVDNDCDGSTDEPYTAKGSNATYFVQPNVTRIETNTWVFSYEASRPKANTTSPGAGNGYWTMAPPGEPLDKTYACSVPNRVPWMNVTPLEAEQTCSALGGTVCTQATWQSACSVNSSMATNNCLWGYNPKGTACTTVASYPPGTKYCNLAGYDFNTNVVGDQDGLLPTGSALLANCSGDWSSVFGNVAAPVNGNGLNKLFDVTGNLREIVKVPNTNPAQYKLMGGAFNTAAEGGAACNFTFYTVDEEFKYFDSGFRCCFASNPTQ